MERSKGVMEVLNKRLELEKKLELESEKINKDLFFEKIKDVFLDDKWDVATIESLLRQEDLLDRCLNTFLDSEAFQTMIRDIVRGTVKEILLNDEGFIHNPTIRSVRLR